MSIRFGYSTIARRSYNRAKEQLVLKVFEDDPVLTRGDSFDASAFLRFLRSRARFIAIAALAAAALASLVSLVLPKRYTAVATILIDAPAGSDPRAAVAMNPAYIESLRSYEMLASSDLLFLRALDKFHLRGSASLDRLKRRILKVNKIRDTKVLEIEVTLPDPQQAQAVAQFLAEQTVALSHDANQASDDDLLAAAQTDLAAARSRLDREQAAWTEFNARQPEQSLTGEVETLQEAREILQSNLLDARADAAENQAVPGPRAAQIRARVQNLEMQDATLARRIQEKSQELGRRNATADQLRQQESAAQASFDAAATRLRDLRALEGMRGERLRVFDPGVAPDRPSSPNLPLNAAVAFLAALMCSIAYLAIVFDPPGLHKEMRINRGA